MQLTKIALASAAVLAFATQAQAVTRVSGASATSVNYMVALAGMCSTGNYKIFKTNTTTNSLGNQFTITCDTTFKYTSGSPAVTENTGETEVRFDVTGGSINSVLFTQEAVTNGEPQAGSGKYLPAVPASCTAITGTGSLAFAGAKLFKCTNALELNQKSVGGFTDVEPPIFKANGVLTSDYSFENATFSQAFGVGVSKDLYEALQTAQGLTVGSTLPAQQPSVSVAKLASLMNNNDFNDAKAKGPKFLLPSTTQTNITYCRRPNTSGTQASAQLFFMSNPVATGLLGGGMTIHGPDLEGAATEVVAGQDSLGNPTGNTLTVKMNSGSGDVKSCLNAAGFAFGVLSAENNPVGGSDTYRFIKIDGKSVTGGLASSAGETNTATAIAGDYDFVYESAVYNPNATPLLTILNSAIRTGGTSPGLFLNSNSAAPESKFGRGNNSVAPYVAQ